MLWMAKEEKRRQEEERGNRINNLKEKQTSSDFIPKRKVGAWSAVRELGA